MSVNEKARLPKAERDAEKRKAAKAKAKKGPNGGLLYLCTVPFYRLGKLYKAGEVVELPADQEPSVTHLPVEDAAPAAKAPEAPKDNKKSPADKQI